MKFNLQLQKDRWYPQLNYKDVCISIYTGLLDAQSREIQFRIIHNFLTVNQNMYKWNLCEPCLCPYCNTHPETTVHLFVSVQAH